MFNGKETVNKVTFLEKDKILRDENEVAKELHSYLNSIVSTSDITDYIFSFEPIDKTIMKLQFYPSTLLIKSKINTGNNFLFR